MTSSTDKDKPTANSTHSSGVTQPVADNSPAAKALASRSNLKQAAKANKEYKNQLEQDIANLNDLAGKLYTEAAEPEDKPKPPKRAIALQYDGLGAPRLTAKGQAQVAEKIVALAEENDVPLYEDAELAAALAHLDLGDEIPELLYMAIAEVLAFVYDLKGKSLS